MKVLILGGTRFLGRAYVDAAVRAGHAVTLFNRGQSNPDLYPEVTTIIGDRDGGLSNLPDENWDVVIDTCGYVPRLVSQSATFLRDCVGRYVFISTISVYSEFGQVGLKEDDGPFGTLEDETVEEITNETYGPLKVLCEQAVEKIMGAERTIIIRPGLIVGPHDPTDRFTYWPWRVAQGGQVLVPNRPDRPIQVTDSRDIADFTYRLLAADATGTFNVSGSEQTTTMGELVDTVRQVSDSDAEFVWVDDQFLLDQEVAPWSQMPLWIPTVDPGYEGFFGFDCSKAFAAGLVCRPLTATVADTLKWLETRPADYEWKAGLELEREREILVAWQQREQTV